MRRVEVVVIVVLAALALGGCATTSGTGSANASTYGGGDGTSCIQAVVIHAQSERSGAPAEYAWLAGRYPGYQREMQALMQCNGHMADQLRIRTAEGREVDVFFDISEYFGRY
jgi:hypothetical protein